MRVAVLGLACVACFGVGNVSAQTPDRGNRGNFDPAQFKQARLDRTKEELEIKDDAEWKAIQPLVEKVMDAQQTVLRDRMSGMFGRSRRPGSDSSSSSDPNSSRRSRGGFGGEPSAESQALQKAIDGKASNSEMKVAIARFQAARKQKMADMEAAQASLKAVLSVRQEAIATAAGLL
jgi:hypothetical protein